jgi:hypothetical protein
LPTRSYVQHYWGRKSLLGRDRTAEFAEIAAYAEKTTYVMEQIHGISALKLDGIHANAWRNLWMVDGGRSFPGADDFAVLGPVKPSSGTAHCVQAIKQAGKWRDEMVISVGAQPAQLPLETVER